MIERFIIEKILNQESGCFDSKHKLNLSEKRTSIELLDKVEAGVTLEELEKIEFPVCRYKTQITIHGIFPEKKSNGYVFGYKHVFQNINKSIGIKYGAIDGLKKKLLSKISYVSKQKELSNWFCRHNSSEFAFERNIRVHTVEEAREKAMEFKKFFETVPADLFYGNYDISLVKDPYGRIYLEVSVPVCAIREEKMNEFTQKFFNMTIEEYNTIIADEEKARLEREELAKIEKQKTIENSQMLIDKYAEENKDKLITSLPKEGLFYHVGIGYSGKGFKLLRRAVILKNGKTQYYKVKSADEVVNTKSKKMVADALTLIGTGKLFLV